MYYYSPYLYADMPWLMPALLLAIVFSFYTSWRVNHVYKQYQDDRNLRGITGADAAREILNRNGLYQVSIREIPGKSLTDYYDSRSQSISLSSDVYHGTSPVAVGVACHEAGHALQYAAEYFPVKVRNAIIPITNIGSKLAMPLILAGVLLSGLSPYLYQLVYVGLICFALCTVFQLVTLPAEFDASRRAMENIRTYQILQGEEQDKAGKVLRAAAMTYVAALAVSLLQLLRFIALYGGRRRR
ncbi:MAG: zinc metallopeptidase [Oscillospiraceae bacterium]|nr:zinc metallopeptidase [Oscillospiraceae bacterium]